MYAIYFQKTIEDERERKIDSIKLCNNKVNIKLKTNSENNNFIKSVNNITEDHIKNSLFINQYNSQEEISMFIENIKINTLIEIDYNFLNFTGKQKYREYLFNNNEFINSTCILYPMGIVYSVNKLNININLIMKLMIKTTETQAQIDLFDLKGTNPALYWSKISSITKTSNTPSKTSSSSSISNSNIENDNHSERDEDSLIKAAKKIKMFDNNTKLPAYLNELLI